MTAPITANCKTCGKTFWWGDLNDYQQLLDLEKSRGGYYCEAHRLK